MKKPSVKTNFCKFAKRNLRKLVAYENFSFNSTWPNGKIETLSILVKSGKIETRSIQLFFCVYFDRVTMAWTSNLDLSLEVRLKKTVSILFLADDAGKMCARVDKKELLGACDQRNSTSILI